MYKKIHLIEEEDSGYYRVYVMEMTGELKQFKFTSFPTKEQIITEYERLEAQMKADELERANAITNE